MYHHDMYVMYEYERTSLQASSFKFLYRYILIVDTPMVSGVHVPYLSYNTTVQYILATLQFLFALLRKNSKHHGKNAYNTGANQRQGIVRIQCHVLKQP